MMVPNGDVDTLAADAPLVNAANKDITDDSGNVLTDVRDAVNHLLGID